MTPEIPMDALRKLVAAIDNDRRQKVPDLELSAAYNAAREVLREHDAQADAAKDDNLAWAILCSGSGSASNTERDIYRKLYPSIWSEALAQARAARAHIAKEQQ